MVALRKPPAIAAEVVVDSTVMSGEPVVRGTRVPAETIVAYLRAGHTNVEIFEDYPTLPIDGIEAVQRWLPQRLAKLVEFGWAEYALTDKLFIDECLSTALVAVAKDRGIIADYGPHIGKGGWQDWNIVPFTIENDYVVVTNNRRHFLREYVRLDLHNGLIIIVPSVEKALQVELFRIALDTALELKDELLNKVVEVLKDGSVHIREWTSDDHDIGHIENPVW